MLREDNNMPYLLKYENVAWYEDGKVSILDRRTYPFKINKVICENYLQVAKAIKDMVTQSAGPYTAVEMGMALAAYESKDLKSKERINFLKKASEILSSARPTTKNRMEIITKRAFEIGKDSIEKGEDKLNTVDRIFQDAIESLNRRYSIMNKVGENLCSLIENNDCILTQCYGETIIGTLIKNLKLENKNIKVYTAETRPYFQGSRLTASCFSEMGFETTVVSDNMIAYLMEKEKINLFTSAADTIALDGSIANKIGTYQIALIGNHFNVPYYVTGIPDVNKKNKNDIVIEMRDGEKVLEFMGKKITNNLVKGIYPSFDVTPSNLIKGIVTDKGVYKPREIKNYFQGKIKNNFY